MGSHLATTDPNWLAKLPALRPDGPEDLEGWMDAWSGIASLTSFVFQEGIQPRPMHTSRGPCAQGERRCVALHRVEAIDPLILRF